jgi:magnesium transporter
MIADCAVYRDGRRTSDGRLSLHDAAGARAGGAFVWLELAEPSEPEMESLKDEFELPELAVEDAHHAHQRPKVEQYGNCLFVVLRTVAYDAGAEVISTGEIHLFLGKSYVIVVRHGAQLEELSWIRRRLEGRAELIQLGPGAVLYGVMDQVVDSYAPVIEEVGSDIDEVEVEVFGAEARETTERIYNLKRQVLELKRATEPLVDPLDHIQSGDFTQLPEEVGHYFRDVYDHIERANEHVENFRELLTSILEANVALVSIRQNDIVRKISGWAAIIAVPTMIAGIYGMNFDFMPELRWRFGYPFVVGLTAAICLTLYRQFKKAHWL